MLSAAIFAHGVNAAQTADARNTLDSYAPFEELLAITPGATTYDPPLRGCIVDSISGGSALVVDTTKSDTYVSFSGVVAAQLIPALITRVYASTTATVICGR